MGAQIALQKYTALLILTGKQQNIPFKNLGVSQEKCKKATTKQNQFIGEIQSPCTQLGTMGEIKPHCNLKQQQIQNETTEL